MPKSLRITASALAATVLIWLLLTIWRSQQPVTVTIENGGPLAIRSFDIVYEHGVVHCGQIPVGQSRTACFSTSDETDYEVTVIFADGSTVTGGGNYAEPGYEFREYVRGRHIMNKLEKLPPF